MADLSAFAPLLGTWRSEVRLAGEEPVFGRTVVRELGDGYLVMEGTVHDPRFPTSLALIGPTEDDDRVVQHYFDSRGVARTMQTSLRDGVWRLERLGAGFDQRYEGRVHGDVIEGRWERVIDGAWQVDFELDYAREA